MVDLLGSSTILCSVGPGVSTVFKDSSASGERKMRERPTLLLAAYSLGLYFEDTLSERLNFIFNNKIKGGWGGHMLQGSRGNRSQECA